MFKRIFICFNAMMNGFDKGCRLLIGVDGCHLKTPYGGVLLVAVALDGNNGLFPVAVRVAESEGNDSWSFFLENLRDVIGGDQPKPWTFMSDQQKVISLV